jgi:two-component system, OmpR family, response regulator
MKPRAHRRRSDRRNFTASQQSAHNERIFRDATLWCKEVCTVITKTVPRVLVVDDEPSIVDALATSLRYEGSTVDEASTGRQALALAQEDPPDLVILDIMLPGLDGLEVTRRLRADGVNVPILFLTARDTLQDKLAGLRIGGDDYVTKPFALAEVIVRVQTILRRIGLDPQDDELLRFADLELDENAHEVRRAGVGIKFTATEFSLLRYFMLNPRHVLSKAQILDYVWHYDFGGEANVVETYVSYLRRKLEKQGPPLIHTVRLVGYVLRETEVPSDIPSAPPRDARFSTMPSRHRQWALRPRG